jgi:DNA-binding CsgD family transcriptional regulator
VPRTEEFTLRAALELAALALHVEHGGGLTSLIGEVAALVGADTASLARIDLDGRDEVAVLWPSSRAVAAARTFAAYPATASTHPVRGPWLRSVREHRPWTLPIQLSQVSSELGWQATPLRREVLGAVTDQLCLPLDYDGTVVTALSLTRFGGLFAPADSDLLALGARHLRAAVARTRGTHTLALRLSPTIGWTPACFAHGGRPARPWPAGAGPWSGSDGAALVSAREREVLDLVAAGLTDAAIGRRLGLATSTVSKHLQRVYRRHHLGNRAVATLWWVERRDR